MSQNLLLTNNQKSENFINQLPKKEQLPFKHLSNLVKVLIKQKAKEKILYLCSKINKVEWSGVMFYSIKGSVAIPSELEIEIIDLIPLDMGTTGFTSYTFDDRVTTYFQTIPNFFELRMGHKMLCPILSN